MGNTQRHCADTRSGAHRLTRGLWRRLAAEFVAQICASHRALVASSHECQELILRSLPVGKVWVWFTCELDFNVNFPSKIDVWLAGLMCIAAAAALLGGYVFASRVSGLGLLGAFCIGVVGAGLLLWMLLSTQYRVEGSELRIQSGPLRWKIATSSITSVTRTRSALSSPALSLDRLRIEYGGGKAIMISPLDREGFLRAIGRAP